jgi:hypothetical protein
MPSDAATLIEGVSSIDSCAFLRLLSYAVQAPAPNLHKPALPEAGKMEVAPKGPIEELTDPPADLGCAPPAVSITFNSPAVKADEAQAVEKPSKVGPLDWPTSHHAAC